jgi:acyl dehydratase
LSNQLSGRRSLVGRVFELADIEVNEHDSALYADVVGDDAQRHADRGTAAPFYAVRLVAPVWRQIYQAPELDTADQLVLHAEQRMLLARDLRLGEVLHARAEVRDLIAFGFGDAAIVRCDLVDADGATVVAMQSTLAMQGSSGLPPERRSARPLAKADLVAQVAREFDDDLPRRYADAADDHNPLHLDDDLAREAGHPSRIVHGLCTLATGITTLVEKVRSDPDDRLTYVRARFARPVLPNTTVDFSAHTTGAWNTYAVGASCGGRAVLKNTWFRMSSGRTAR